MRPAAKKLMGAALAAMLLIGFAMPVVLAGPFEDCVQQCIDQWEADKQACDDQLATRLAELDQEAQQCLSDNAGDPIATGLCLREVNIKRANAQSDYQKCISLANTVAYNCYRDCQMTASQP